MNFLNSFSSFIIDSANYLWNGPVLVTLLLGGGLYFLVRSRFIPLFKFPHSFKILFKKKYSGKGLSSFESVSSQVAGIVGMGNISGVAVAISLGGPGAIFWMWVTSLFGMITKFYTCSLAVLYRDEVNNKNVGGPMSVIVNGLGKNWKPLATVFCFFGLLGVSPIFQSNQIVETVNNIIFQNKPLFDNQFYNDFFIGIILISIVSLVILGGIQRIGTVASKLAPIMVITYLLSVIYIMLINFDQIIPSFMLIITEAFNSNSLFGGAAGSVILIGARRASFSNEAGIGTAPIIHASSNTNDPIEEGMVSMIGPFIDTIVVCTLTALCILVTDTWRDSSFAGIEMVIESFVFSMPLIGKYLILFTTLTFAISTLFSLSFFGERCLAFLIGEKYKNYYRYIYLILILIGSTSSLQFVISVIDLSYGIMAFPTMLSAIYLAPEVEKYSKKYFKKLR
jgi:AGCS family alanine or glycine:cation symporter